MTDEAKTTPDVAQRAVKAAMAELFPSLKEVSRLVASAPLPKEQRAGLAVMVLAHFAGGALAALELDPTPEGAQELGRILAYAMAKGMH